MKLKAILCDFDGTLIDKNNKYNAGVKKLIAKIKLGGVHFSLATGRAYFSYCNKVLNELEVNDFHIFHGGALIYNNGTKTSLWSQPISASSVRKIIPYLQNFKVNFALEAANYAYMNNLVTYPTYGDKQHLIQLSEINDYSNILKILIFSSLNKLTEKQIDLIKDNLTAKFKDVSFMKFYANGNGMDITSEKATKHAAVLEYERLLKIPRNQIVAIGDGYNDYPLFTACGYKIAMNNAPKELKEIADFIAPTIENNGTVVTLRHIISKFL